mgnify:CR=1 FL=1
MKRLFATLYLLSFSAVLFGQELSVKEFKADPADISAVRYEVKDLNGNICALVRIGLVLQDVTFEGSVVKSEFKDGEWWVYMVDKSWWLNIKTKKYLPLRYEFPEPVQKKSTYIMQVEVPQVAYDGPTGKMLIKSNVRSGDVYVDGEKLSSILPYEYTGPEGQHIVEIRSSGYNTERMTFEIALGRKGVLNVTVKAEGSFSLDGISYEMVNIPAGQFQMGMSGSVLLAPVHPETVRGFSIGKTEVTQALWKAVMGSTPSLTPDDSRPVENISWYDAQEFISRLNAMSNSHFRLPTEAEWEYAAGQSKILGIEGMTEGVAEWCEDWYGSYGASNDGGYVKIVRGGPFQNTGWPSSATFRGFLRPDEFNSCTGLRLAQDEL